MPHHPEAPHRPPAPDAGPVRLVLASASPARLAVLRAAGVEPLVRVSHVDEDAVAAALPAGAPPRDVVAALARAKALTIADAHHTPAEGAAGAPERGGEPERGGVPHDAVIVGCDSMLHIAGTLRGKPHTLDEARRRWTEMAGRSGTLLTGHSVVRVDGGEIVSEASGVSSTTVRFASPSAGELEAYLRSGEPLEVAGAFTLDGLGGWFVDAIEGDPSSVVGIGLPLVRRLLGGVGLDVAHVWAANPRIPAAAPG